MKIFTARKGYYHGKAVDITVADCASVTKLFAPTWAMVRGLKSGRIDEKEYTRLYMEKLNSIPDNGSAMDGRGFNIINGLIRFMNDGELTLLCFCKSGVFCHRVLLARWLEELGYGVYEGEK